MIFLLLVYDFYEQLKRVDESLKSAPKSSKFKAKTPKLDLSESRCYSGGGFAVVRAHTRKCVYVCVKTCVCV